MTNSMKLMRVVRGICQPVCVVLLLLTAGVLSAQNQEDRVRNAAEEASSEDRVFVGKVSQGGMYEVEASKVAIARATAPDVKDVAATEAHDPEGVNQWLKQIASSTGVEVSGELNPEFQRRLDKLKALSSAEFDQAYITDMQQIHDKDENLFASEATKGSSNYRSFAHQTDLIVKRHIGALNAPDTM